MTEDAQIDLIDYYQSLYQGMILDKTLPKQFVIYQAGDETGWGNKLRGIYSAFLLALLTKRIFLTDYSLFLEAFDPPAGMEWNVARFKNMLRSPQTVFELDPCHRPQEMQMLSTTDLAQTFPQTVLLHTQGNTFDTALLSNPYYQTLLRELLSDEVSRINAVGRLMSFLLQNPSQHFLTLVHRAKHHLGWSDLWNEAQKIGVQLRTFYDIGSPHLKYADRFIQNLDAALKLKRGSIQTSGKTLFFVTTDNLEVTSQVANSLQNLGTVTFNRKPVVHTGADCSTLTLKIICLLDRLFNKISNHFWQLFVWHLPPELVRIKIDWYALLPQMLRHRPQYSALVDWYLLGECNVLISTMTSYAVLASARTSNAQTLIKIDLESNNYELMNYENYTL